MRLSKNFYFLVLFITFFISVVSQNYRKVSINKIKAEGKVWGIDLSHHQGDINWEKLKKEKPYFIFFKATEGVTHNDRNYREHYNNARKHGIIVGSYHFFSYKSSGKAQAKHFISVARFQKGDLPPVLDVEYRKKMPDHKKVTKEIKDFLVVVLKSTGYKPIIYCDYDFYKQYLKSEIKTDYYLWICDYRRQPTNKWLFWQITDKFKISGISGYVDFNLFNGNKQKLKNILIQ
jgi:lysozyme